MCATIRLHEPDADLAVSVAGKERGSIGGPLERAAVRLDGLLAERCELRGKLVDDDLGLEVPDLDRLLRGGAEPVAVRLRLEWELE